jgi:hypothetical protein
MMLSVLVRKIWGISLELRDCQILKPMDGAEVVRVGQKVRVPKTRRYLPQDDLRGHRPCYELCTCDRWKESVVPTCGVDVSYIL